ncbi:neuroligin-4, Y-linked-like [Adelges cooleyi]|uniref:neuroligin-4, Y-linked-like n=1 Tax=Adelges cooleyi TaxID=133065 RepID=UPI00217FB6E9|nr:neuroligin-4, Y-linked-like [Adelges cooleyi]
MASVTALLLLLLAVGVTAVRSARADVLGYTDTVRLDRQGPLKGLLTTVGGPGGHLDQVEVYLGVPYASQERFMPPGAPPAWCASSASGGGGGGHGHGHCRPLLAEYLKPVCPQKLPEIGDAAVGANKRLSAVRQNYLKRLLPYLGNQSEDCLYLNIYAPHDSKSEMNEENDNSKPIKKSKYAVIMFIHGESFEWNSGNPYDGSVLASFGKVIFVTINYRVGVLGFLKSNGGDNPASNFGLLDQVAALEWIKNNIQAFGGNPNAVTVMGHGTGAACANFLMMAPPVNNNDLFQRAILMSGSALSDWALVKNPIVNMIQVGQSVKCDTGEDEMFFDCLRRKRFTDLVSAKVYAPPFAAKFGPMVDGVMVTNEPLLLLKEHKSLMRRYNVLMGVTEYESYHLLDSVSLVHGMLENEQHSMLLDYMKAKFELFPDLTLTATLAQYADRDRSWSSSDVLENRDVLLEILSDAMVLAPLSHLADIQSEVNEHTYFYVFTHRSSFNEYDVAKKSINGEDLPYVLGVPLGGNTIHFKTQFDQKEKRLSEMIMAHWSNFAKTGDPSFSKRSSQADWKMNARWPKYSAANHAYLELNLTTRPRANYRVNKCKFWNVDLPQRIEEKRQKDAEQSKLSLPSIPTRFIPPWTEHDSPVFSFPTPMPDDPNHSGGFPDDPNPGEEPSAEPSDKRPPEVEESSSSVVVSLIIIIGICFLLVNICAFGGIYYQRDKLRVRERLFNNRFRCNEANTSRTFDDDENDVYTKAEDPELADIHKFGKSEVYDSVALASVKPEAIGGKRLGKWAEISRQRSSSTVTMDPHTRVKEWINTEIIQRYSPRILRRQRREEKKRQLVCAEDPVEATEKVSSELSQVNKSRNKVSVAIDATPAARTISVLKQTPIELTKSMDAMAHPERVEIKPSLSLGSIGRNPLKRSDAMNESDNMLSSTDTLHKSSTSIQLKPATKEKRPGIKVVHGYSKSEPARDTFKEVLYSQVSKPKATMALSKNPSFESSTHYEDINVTSREYNGGDSSSVDSLRRIKYPKVLPDFPNDRNSGSADRRLSLPPPAFASIPEGGTIKIPPPPPPRISSTLGRKKDTKSEVTVMFAKTPTVAIPEEHKSLVVPCVPNKVCPPSLKKTSISSSATNSKKSEPRIVIKAGSKQQQQPKRVNIPRVVHPQNSDKSKSSGDSGDTGTIKRKKK